MPPTGSRRTARPGLDADLTELFERVKKTENVGPEPWIYFTPVAPATAGADYRSTDPRNTPYEAPWVNLGGTYVPGGFRWADTPKHLELRLAITGDELNPGSLIATTPVGYRPEFTTTWFVRLGGTGIGTADWHSDGTINFVDRITGAAGPPGGPADTGIFFSIPNNGDTLDVTTTGTTNLTAEFMNLTADEIALAGGQVTVFTSGIVELFPGTELYLEATTNAYLLAYNGNVQIGSTNGDIALDTDNAEIYMDEDGDIRIFADDFELTNTTLGFFGTTGVAQQTSVPVTAAGIHAALSAYGLIT